MIKYAALLFLCMSVPAMADVSSCPSNFAYCSYSLDPTQQDAEGNSVGNNFEMIVSQNGKILGDAKDVCMGYGWAAFTTPIDQKPSDAGVYHEQLYVCDSSGCDKSRTLVGDFTSTETVLNGKATVTPNTHTFKFSGYYASESCTESAEMLRARLNSLK